MRQPVPFGKYLLLDRISVGGMAEVFKAKSYGVEGFEKIIAIKRILPTMGEDREFIKMFIDEAKIAGQLTHANICQIFELGRIDGSHFIAMEYIWGKDLLQIQNRLRKLKQPMPIVVACFCMAKVLEGLDYAHRKRDPLGRPLEIVHRDCSPQNVLVSYEGEVKVIDFGIAKATSRNSRTMAGVLKGKFGYMSPEQVRGLPLDRRSDIFALGTMLYECVIGDRLFQGETDFSTLERVRNVDIRPPREINAMIPPAVEAVIMKALAKDVDARYQWCSEMLADLQAFLMSEDVVFTAKSLSSWLKEVFAAEIAKERQLLEHYKRVGRDGLISGVPAAAAQIDVIGSLGPAPPIEGDPTVLGGPSFDDIEHPAGAALQVGPAPGSPATRAVSASEGAEDTEDFGEEAPTEIFGEIDHGAKPVAAQPASHVPAGSQRPAARPSRPLPANGLPPTPAANPGQGRTLIGATPPVGPPNYARGYPPQQQGAYPGLPGQTPMPQAGYPPGPSGQTPVPLPGYPPGPLGQTPTPQPGTLDQAAMSSGAPAPGVPPMAPSQTLGPQGFPYPPLQQPPYGQPGSFNPAVPLEHPVEGRRRPSIARDVAIGVAIAAAVLGGFLAAKFAWLDRDAASDELAGAPVHAHVKVRSMLPGGEAVHLFVDGKQIATVTGEQDIEVTAGPHKLKLVGRSGSQCERDVVLVAGKSFGLDCGPGPAAGSGAAAGEVAAAGGGSAAGADPATGPGSGASAGSAVSAGSGASADPAADSAAGSGSAVREAGADVGPATGPGSAVGSKRAAAAGRGSDAGTSEAPDHAVPDKADRMLAEDPESSEVKATDRASAHSAGRAAGEASSKSGGRRKSTRSAPVDDDPLGTLQGGIKPGDGKM